MSIMMRSKKRRRRWLVAVKKEMKEGHMGGEPNEKDHMQVQPAAVVPTNRYKQVRSNKLRLQLIVAVDDHRLVGLQAAPRLEQRQSLVLKVFPGT